MADAWTRKYLNDRGYSDDQIKYDKDRNMVTAGGLDFITPTTATGGKTFASMSDLDAAFGRMNQTTGQTKSNNLMSQLEQALAKPFEIPSFSFNAETDPRYQQAMQIADLNANQATGNALAGLASRGIENGSIMGDRAAQIQQQERAKVSGQLVPQLYAQAYDQFANELGLKYKANQDQLSGLSNLLGIQNNQNQLSLDNMFRDKSFNWQQGVDTRNFDRSVLESDRGYDRGVVESDRNYEHQTSRDSVVDEQWQKEFDQRVKQDGVQNAIAWANNKISQQNANRLSAGGGGSSTPKAANLNTAITNINKLYTRYDSTTGKRSVTDPAKVKAYIDSMGLPDDQKSQLYSYYGVSSGNGGGLWGTLKDVLGGIGKTAAGLNNSTVSDKDIEQYLK